jgi:AcrR family transcriptional regulator
MAGGTLRERHKSETRTAILSAALDLFEQNGYDQTTVEDIAARAGIAARTFFRYFESKTALVLHDGHEHDDTSDDELADALVARPAHESPAEAMAAVLRDKLAAIFEDDDRLTLRQLRVLLAEPSLRVLAQNSFHDHRPDLVRAFAARLQLTTDDLAPRVLAAALTEVIWVILERWASASGELSDLPDMIDQAFASVNNSFL